MITITDRAAEQMKAAAAQAQAEKDPLRLAVKTNDDGSFQYAMGFDTETEEDIIARSGGVKFVIRPEYAEMLNGMTIDFAEVGPGDLQFIFMNPNDPTFVAPTE